MFIESNYITSIAPNAFSGLSSLAAICPKDMLFVAGLLSHCFTVISCEMLHSNSLTELPQGVFSDLINVEQIHLPVLFRPFCWSVPCHVCRPSSVLKANSFTSLPPGVFSGIKRLVVLYSSYKMLCPGKAILVGPEFQLSHASRPR